MAPSIPPEHFNTQSYFLLEMKNKTLYYPEQYILCLWIPTNLHTANILISSKVKLLLYFIYLKHKYMAILPVKWNKFSTRSSEKLDGFMILRNNDIMFTSNSLLHFISTVIHISISTTTCTHNYLFSGTKSFHKMSVLAPIIYRCPT